MIKTELWNGHEIRFIEKESGEWWAILKDVTEALELTSKGVKQRLDDEVISNYPIEDRFGRQQDMLIVNETGIYEVVFSSRKKEAKEFRKWVFETIKFLRQASGLEGFQIFRMLDKEHQKEMMAKLNDGIKNPAKVDFIKANTITDKAVSNMFGYKKMVKKDDMTPDMLIKREPVLSDVVNLMVVNSEFNLGCSISEKIYDKYH